MTKEAARRFCRREWGLFLEGDGALALLNHFGSFLQAFRSEKGRGRLLIYLPLKDELDYLHLLSDLPVELYAPRISAGSMQFHRCDSSSLLSNSFERGVYGIRVPAAAAPKLSLPLGKEDWVILPALGAGGNGCRLGRGGGFYDRWRHHLEPARRLALLPDHLRGLSFQTEPHDLQITYMISETGLHF